ncbi:LysR family transcriptional regulator [uncultured Cohaesibacter sp.]|uniref:LysR family transcriptional regulator n=1 Tax=uncultured Cohaesibacter sp. TaxID=1002546 RepID=UPI002AAC1C96|nr:LysR family transcriptional regulator [uncultured Cohaesibacter sp.]
MMSKLDIGALQALCAIRDHGGVSRAARQLALSQSAVSHKIRRLEKGLGCQLLTRQSGQPVFTEEGEQLLTYARRILSLNDEAITSLGTEVLSGVVRLGITEEMSHGTLVPVLGRFARLQPDVSVYTDVAQSLVIAEQLHRGVLDVGVFQLFSDECRRDDILLSEDDLVWAKSRDLILDFDRPIPFLAFDNRCFYRRWAMETAPQPPHGLSIVLKCASVSGIMSSLRSGLGISLVGRRQITDDLEIIQGRFAKPPRVATVLRKRNQAPSHAVLALARQIACLTQQCAHPA